MHNLNLNHIITSLYWNHDKLSHHHHLCCHYFSQRRHTTPTAPPSPPDNTTILTTTQSSEFLGDKISSYGGKLRFTLSFVGDENPRLEFPLIRILGNSILALDYHPADAPMPIPADNVFEVSAMSVRSVRD